jgi:hypothetical protein
VRDSTSDHSKFNKMWLGLEISDYSESSRTNVLFIQQVTYEVFVRCVRSLRSLSCSLTNDVGVKEMALRMSRPEMRPTSHQAVVVGSKRVTNRQGA